LRHLPPDSGLRLRLGLISENLDPGGDGRRFTENTSNSTAEIPAVSYFVGCLADHLEQNIARATSELTRRATNAPPAIPAEQGCCGQAAYSCGDFEQARKLAKRNISAFARNKLPILTSCSSCYRHLLRYPDLFAGEPQWQERAMDFACRLLEFSTFFVESGAVPRVRSGTVFYHDPCHLRFGLKICEPPRRLLEKAGLQLVELPDGPRCCGQGGLFNLAQPELTGRIRDRLLLDFQPLAAEMVTTTCSGCLLQWRQGLKQVRSKIPSKHLAEVLNTPLQ
jgi:glycolate oxidase iron-sulfur subunit